MNDYERLGVFYLGRRYRPETGEPDGETVLYDSRDLTTHAVCVGMTGSGKTGLGISILEEAAMDGVPAICIDPKGDLGNLALRFPALDAASFAPWIDPGEAARRNQTPEQRATDVSNKWKSGLAEWHQDGERIRAFQRAADVAVFTPGSRAGRPLSVLGSFAPPPAADGRADRIQTTVSSLLGLLGIESDPLTSREHVLLSTLFERAWSAGETLDLARLVREVTNPPVPQVGVLPLDTFFPSKERQKLALQLNSLIASPAFEAWRQGPPLDVQRLLWSEDGRPQLSVLSVAHLSEAERMFFVTLVLGEVVAWMRAQPGTPSLRALVYMDEVFGFLPPVAEPPSKAPLLTLLKQARAYGVGVVLSTQNPVDLDYKALSNCGTWMLGRLQTEQDVDRMLDGLRGTSTNLDVPELRRTLAGLPGRVFLMRNVHETAPVLFHTRWVMSYLRGPLTVDQIASLAPEASSQSEPSKTPPTDEPTRSTTTQKASRTVRPVLPDGIDEAFIKSAHLESTGSASPGGDVMYEPAWLAHVRSHYVLKRAGVDAWFERVWLAPLSPGTAASLWQAAKSDEPSRLQTAVAPAEGASFTDLPQGAVTAKRMRSIRSALKTHIYRTHPMTIGYVRAFKMYSTVGEDRGAFAARVHQAAREARDADLEKLRSKYAKRFERLQDRITRAKERVAREKAQVSKGSLDTVLSVGTTVLGAILGRRTSAATTARRAASSLSKAGNVAKERRDVSRAEDRVEDLEGELKELEAEFQVKTRELREANPTPTIEPITINPRKADFEIVRFALAWVPRQRPVANAPRNISPRLQAT